MEIGSEFWKFNGSLSYDNSEFWKLGKDTKFTLSGRTSIYYILKNILKKNNVKKVYLPSYSCDSMAQPFIDLGIEVEYYNVYYNDGIKYDIDLDREIDIFFAMNYFGYSSTNMDLYIKSFKEKGKIVIEDITHSILAEKKFSSNSDYLVGSLRKWFPIASGGIAVNMNSKFDLELDSKSNYKMIDIKNLAMQNKKEYIENQKEISKETFLNQYNESGKILDKDYKDYSIDDESLKIIMGIDIKEIINIRIENVKTIYNKLKNNTNIKFLIDNYNEKDGLLFVPIILDHEKRDFLREYLIKNKVYIPVHWPLENKINNIFESELSLVCDQRYNKKQISEYIDLIINYFN